MTGGGVAQATAAPDAFFSCGSVMRKRVYSPGLVAMPTRPPALLTRSRTTSMPMPRAPPSPTVVKPARKMRLASLRGSMRPRPRRSQHALAHGLGADLVVIESAAVVLHAELVAIGADAQELHGDRADLGLVLHHAIGRRLDAVANRVVDELAEHLLDHAAIVAGHVLEADAHQRDPLAVHVGEELRHLLETFLREIGEALGLLRLGDRAGAACAPSALA